MRRKNRPRRVARGGGELPVRQLAEKGYCKVMEERRGKGGWEREWEKRLTTERTVFL